ncbi:MAG: histidinol-phosphate transaminase [Lachnospiraceae bacterium]|nr:histidinol-phosphate transaminase [Lachnospiraceae bacterium]
MNWEENVRRVVPYVAGEQPKDAGVIKLNTNECPYPPAPGVSRLAREFETADLRLYPALDASPLSDALAERYGVSRDRVFVGVGSDDVLSMIFLTFFNSHRPVLFADVTYSFYDVWASVYHIPYRQIPLLPDFHQDIPAYLSGEAGGIVIANPNAPTGLSEDLPDIERILQANPGCVVVVDEAYVDFGGTSALPLLETYDNLLVVQTFSKSRSMAGMRIGFCIGSEKLIGYLNDVKFSINSYTMNRPSLVCGAEAVRDEEYFQKTVAKVVSTRERAKKELTALGFSFPDSDANFLFATHREIPAQDLYEYLRDRKIYVRHWNKPRIENYLRITVGTDEQMEALYAALRERIAKA